MPKTKVQKSQNVIEAIGGIVNDAASQLTEVIKPEEIFNQVIGLTEAPKKASSEFKPGQELKMDDFFSGKTDAEKKLEAQVSYERQLRTEQLQLSEKKIGELRLRLNAIIQEVAIMVKSTQGLAQEVQTAAMQAPTEASIYHVSFFEKLLTLLVSFRKKIDSAAAWLSTVNKRSEKKNYWAMYKKSKGSFLLSPESYTQRSAG